MKNIETYQILATEKYNNFYSSATENKHIINVATSIMMHRDNVINGGSFVQAFVENKLSEAISRADDEVINHFKFFDNVKRFAYIDE